MKDALARIGFYLWLFLPVPLSACIVKIAVDEDFFRDPTDCDPWLVALVIMAIAMLVLYAIQLTIAVIGISKDIAKERYLKKHPELRKTRKDIAEDLQMMVDALKEDDQE